MVTKNSFGYRFGRLLGKGILIDSGYFLAKRWGRKPINDHFPETPQEGGE